MRSQRSEFKYDPGGIPKIIQIRPGVLDEAVVDLAETKRHVFVGIEIDTAAKSEREVVFAELTATGMRESDQALRKWSEQA